MFHNSNLFQPINCFTKFLVFCKVNTPRTIHSFFLSKKLSVIKIFLVIIYRRVFKKLQSLKTSAGVLVSIPYLFVLVRGKSYPVVLLRENSVVGVCFVARVSSYQAVQWVGKHKLFQVRT